MSKARIVPVIPEKAQGDAKDLFNKIQKSAGKVPNIFQHMANSPAVLKAFLSMQETMGQLSLNSKIRSQIALVVAQANNCQYCLSAHTALASNAGLPQDQILQARKGEASDPKAKAILQFAKLVVQKKGNVTEQDVKKLKDAGINDQELVEIIFCINANMFTNYFNHIVDTPVDFPAAQQLQEVGV